MKSTLLNLIAIFVIEILTISGLSGQKEYNLAFDLKEYEFQTFTLGEKVYKVRAYENIIYVSNPVDTLYQKMNIYIPEEYFEKGSLNGYTSITAPIFFPNKIGGYMQALPATLKPGESPGGMPQRSVIFIALSKGYVVASPGVRGRTTINKSGIFTGKAPAAIIDLKAAVRYLKFNDRIMPGDANKIISNGTSAGGALSALLGASGNNPDYEPYLKALGAADAADNIFAVSAYCPITNLENADKAYEWQFDGIYTYQKRGFPQGKDQEGPNKSNLLTDDQIAISKQLKKLFPGYVNSLKLKDKDRALLTLDTSGNGNFKTLVKSYIMASAQKAINEGSDLSGLIWLKVENKIVTDLDYNAYLKYLGRMKTPPAFDALDLSTPENQLFGTEKTDKQHFTEFSSMHSLVAATTSDSLEIKMMNPMNYIGKPQTYTADHWRIRHGTRDKDTSLAIPVMLAVYLENKKIDVNLEFAWDRPHSGDYDPDELFDWADSLCR